MRGIIRLFFKLVHLIVGPILLLWELLLMPKGVERSEVQQREVDSACSRLTLYQYKTCPFCIKVRRAIKRLSLKIAVCDAQHEPGCQAVLVAGGGSLQVPCLRIEEPDGVVRWLYESDAIIRYLRQRFAG